ncbi:MAG TPA: hypothetical protein VFR99_06555 [Marmoricola sp.]|nr:hypothetical protein [Marmoricola sp.]
MTIPSPEQFLAGPSDPEDDDTAEEPLSPLESIADSLRGIHVLMDRFDADRAGDPCQAHASALHESQELCDSLREANADLADKHRAVFELVEEIEGIVKPSTSKLANSVREAIGAGR